MTITPSETSVYSIHVDHHWPHVKFKCSRWGLPHPLTGLMFQDT